MIEEKYIELMNKEIDHLITSEERIRLHNYISVNNEAKEYYDELLLTNESLNHIPDHQPSENLKIRILNSINFNKYNVKTVKNKSLKILRVANFRFVYTFAAGLIAGIIIYSLFFVNAGNVNPDDISGTIGINNSAKTIGEIPLNFPGISGNIELKEKGSTIWFNIHSNSSQPADYIITYPRQIQFEYIKPGSSANMTILKSENYIKTSNSGSQEFTLAFTQNNTPSSPIHIQLTQSGNLIHDYEFSLKK